MFVVDLNNAYYNSMYGKTSNSSCTSGQVIEPGSHKTVVQASLI